MRRIEKPKEAEYAPYAIQYIGLLPDDGLVLEHLQKNFEATRAFLLSQPEDRLLYRYATDKWTIKEIVLHLADDEPYQDETMGAILSWSCVSYPKQCTHTSKDKRR
jgi:hypothetical protein